MASYSLEDPVWSLGWTKPPLHSKGFNEFVPYGIWMQLANFNSEKGMKKHLQKVKS